MPPSGRSNTESRLNGGHPGGTLPLTHATATSLHDQRLPENLYVADSTLLPRSLGLPPILTIVALATRVARVAAPETSETIRRASRRPVGRRAA